MADEVCTSQSTIAAYESGSKSPTVRTIEKFANKLGLKFFTSFYPPLTREDRRSLAYHGAIVKKIRANPTDALKRAQANLAKTKRMHPDAWALLNQWSAWLALPLDKLEENLLHPGLFEREMRQVSPFAGLLSARERNQILIRFRRERAQ